MTDVNELSEGQLPPAPAGVGAQLRAAREARGLSIAQISAETRISERHLGLLEAGDFAALPGRTYAVGFARNFAKVVGLDQADIAAQVRIELGDELAERGQQAHFQPGDPARAPGRGLVWFSIFAVLLLLAGLFVAARELLVPGAELPSLTEQADAEQAEAEASRAAAATRAVQPVDAGGAVTFTAQGAVWVRFYEAEGRRLKEGELAAGESYTIPADAVAPQVLTGRPDLLAITIAGRAVPKLSEDTVTVSDVPVDAPSLLARPAPAAAPVQAPVQAPAAVSSSSTPAATAPVAPVAAN